MTQKEKFIKRENLKEKIWVWLLDNEKTVDEICDHFKFSRTNSRAIIDKMMIEKHLTRRLLPHGDARRPMYHYKAVEDRKYIAKQPKEFVQEFSGKIKDPLKTYSEFGGIIMIDRDNPNKRTYLNLESHKTAKAPRPKRKTNVWIGTSMGSLGEASDY
jgi:hypothetical protein